jgi:MFS family permease
MHMAGNPASRPLVVLVGATVLVDSLFYAALTPLLPQYAQDLELSKTGAGILSGAYAAGGLLGSFPGAWLAARLGSRRTLLIGSALVVLAGVGFAFSKTIALLDATRFLLGVGGACSWAGAMGWLISTTPPHRRGATIGNAMSAAVVGFLLGPAVGAVARLTGPELPFTIVAGIVTGLAVLMLRIDAPARGTAAHQAHVIALGDPRIRTGAGLVAIASLAFGCLEVLVPLRFDSLGAGGVAIGATFIAAAAVEGVAQLIVGRATDRWGRAALIRLGLTGMVASMLLLPLPQGMWLLVVAVVLAWVTSGALNTPSVTLVSDGVESLGLDHGVGFASVNFVWAGGQVAGAAAGGTLAAATSDSVVYLVLAALCAVTLASSMMPRSRAILEPVR